MTITAQVNYHVTSDETQAFHIDAGGEKGKLVSPELVATSIAVQDVRTAELNLNFMSDSVAYFERPSQVKTFDDQRKWQATYDRELVDLLTEKIGAREVIVFDHTVRIDDPHSGRKPARNVHSDYSPEGAQKRLRDLLGEENAKEWEKGHYAFINVWRPVQNPINSAPLGFVRPRSVQSRDWITLQLIYPDRTGQIMGLVANENHEWVYRSKMTPDEIAVFNIYDNQGLASIAHSALDMTEDSTIQTPRMSIESRTLVRYQTN